MSTITASISPAIREFATAVRTALDDLSAEEIDDLTDGLEADLDEQSRDAGDSFELGDPVAYAEELRSSAGLPPRAEKPRRFQPIAGLRRWRTDAASRIRSNRAGAAALDFLLALRPVWWVLRGWAVFQLVVPGLTGYWTILPQSFFGSVLLLAMIVGSVQWGRKRWLRAGWLRVLKLVVSVIVVIALPFQLGMMVNILAQGTQGHVEYIHPDGLSMNGEQVRNIFAYDADGNPLTDVQLFTQDGEPLITVQDSSLTWDQYGWDPYAGYGFVPNERAGRGGWGVYPLRTAEESGLDYTPYGEPIVDWLLTTPATPPFEQARPLTPDAAGGVDGESVEGAGGDVEEGESESGGDEAAGDPSGPVPTPTPSPTS